MTVADVVERLGARRNGSGWSAKCASLSIGEGEGGRVLVSCHAGCEVEEVVEALGLSMRDLFPGGARPLVRRNGASVRERPAPPPLTDEQVEGMHAALLADGQAWRHVVEVLRLDPEVVEAERLGLVKDPDGRRWLAYPYRHGGRWTFANLRSLDGDKAFRRFPARQATTLYNGDALEPGGLAVVTEGERDALSALSMRLDAELGGAAVVAIPGAEHAGAGWALGPLRSQHRVYVALDADPAGDRAAEKMIAALGSTAVRLRPPGGFKDLGDLLAGRGAEEGLAVVLDARGPEAESRGRTRRRVPRGLPWIAVCVDHVRHRKMLDLAERLCDPGAPLHLAAAWCWVAETYPLGTFPAHAVAALERAALWQGEAGALAAALVDVELLDRLPGARFAVHDWDVYQGPHMRKWATDREHARRARERKAAEGVGNARATVARPSSLSSPSSSTT